MDSEIEQASKGRTIRVLLAMDTEVSANGTGCEGVGGGPRVLPPARTRDREGGGGDGGGGGGGGSGEPCPRPV